MRQHKLLIILLMAVILASSAYAVGISPAKKVIDFEPGQKEITFKIFNDNKDAMKAVIYVRGSLAEYVSIKEALVTMSRDDEFKEFTFLMDLPDNVGDPGIHSSEIVVMELPDEYNGDSSVVTARASVVAELSLRVPYPGKYAVASLNIPDAEVGNDVRFTIPIQNYGKQPIFHAKANIELFGATYEKIAYIETNDLSISTKEQGKLIAIWKADVNPGVYHAKATVYYDDQKLEIEKDFNIGSAGLEITKIIAEDFKLGDVAIFDIFLKNNWNDKLSSIHGKMTITGKDGTVYGTYNTETIDLEPYEEEMVKAYWNTRDAKIGTYQLNMAIEFGKAVIEKAQDINVNLDSISVGPSAQVIGVEAGIITKESILTTLVLLLIIVNIGWFFYFMRKKKRP